METWNIGEWFVVVFSLFSQVDHWNVFVGRNVVVHEDRGRVGAVSNAVEEASEANPVDVGLLIGRQHKVVSE